MRIEVDGEAFEIPDTEVLAYAEQLKAHGVLGAPEQEVELVPPNKFIFGLNVMHTRELKEMGRDIAAFMETVGEGEVEVQVSVNAKLNEHNNRRIGFLQDAHGEIEYTEADMWDDEDDDYPEEE